MKEKILIGQETIEKFAELIELSFNYDDKNFQFEVKEFGVNIFCDGVLQFDGDDYTTEVEVDSVQAFADSGEEIDVINNITACWEIEKIAQMALDAKMRDQLQASKDRYL